MFDDLDDLLEDVPQHKSKPSIGSQPSAKGPTQVSLGLANKRPQTAKVNNNEDEFDWDRPHTASHHQNSSFGAGSQPQNTSNVTASKRPGSSVAQNNNVSMVGLKNSSASKKDNEWANEAVAQPKKAVNEWGNNDMDDLLDDFAGSKK